ncbi:transcriptional regulator [Aromatoleum evansii]|uniref:Transcriptional regulator n=1 Tax=Aromatoleum evansii TaxID=59406 RepID=A0ABZ1ATD8_AROEV|nr:transcriptional regulator [Aromatoleum evansii]
MELKPIRTDAEHREALAEIERLWDAPESGPEADRLEVLALLVEAYEKAHHPIDAPDPVAFLEYVMDSRGLTRKDLEPYIGPRGRVADIMNRTRPLTVAMIRRLSAGLGLPADVLIQPYPLRESVAA